MQRHLQVLVALIVMLALAGLQTAQAKTAQKERSFLPTQISEQVAGSPIGWVARGQLQGVESANKALLETMGWDKAAWQSDVGRLLTTQERANNYIVQCYRQRAEFERISKLSVPEYTACLQMMRAAYIDANTAGREPFSWWSDYQQRLTRMLPSTTPQQTQTTVVPVTDVPLSDDIVFLGLLGKALVAIMVAVLVFVLLFVLSKIFSDWRRKPQVSEDEEIGKTAVEVTTEDPTLEPVAETETTPELPQEVVTVAEPVAEVQAAESTEEETPIAASEPEAALVHSNGRPAEPTARPRRVRRVRTNNN